MDLKQRGEFGAHEIKVKDAACMQAFRNAIVHNKHLFSGKVVLHIGCSTAVLSMLAARVGASHVFAIDTGSIVDHARRVVAANGLSGCITLIDGKVEDIELPVKQVDVIISEWMGYGLLCESRLASVLFARDKWLAEAGVIMPDRCTLYMCGLQDLEYKRQAYDWWRNVLDTFDMSCVRQAAIAVPVIDAVDCRCVVTNRCPVGRIDARTLPLSRLHGAAAAVAPIFDTAFCLACQRDDWLHAIVLYFDVEFSACHCPTVFSTGPDSPSTRWKQIVLYLESDRDEYLAVKKGEELIGHFKMRPGQQQLEIDLGVEFVGEWSRMEEQKCFVLRHPHYI